ncbi:outer membrane protein assembly factor BamE [Ignatzschineria rhizosphaerae]|uniref:Outer membrane protein assembly factor BamE n=1 Tax=Ignatzschineria rhizosphaerae TaxID=2923279 RepID=A0ABY3X1G1_9GAMM|nr:outer membrane protein assembly factor BamE [Ignatzschineria rhizosphaerae]UNM96714.1 outer membrane protein assembly factor BamE [Ignatzschineria rhizosphaerae]
MKKMKYFMLLGVAILAVGCSKFSMHRVDVYQGNYIEQQRLENLKPGMTRSEVQLLLGTPLVQDVYDPSVWYYVFFHSDSDGKVKESKQIQVHFDRDGRYQYYNGDIGNSAPIDTASVEAE